MIKKIFLVALFILGLTAVSFAQTVTTPAKGSAERTALLNALRAPVEKELKQKVVFEIDTFKVQGNWAFINGRPRSDKGGELDYSKTEYAEAKREGMFDDNFQALLKKTAGKWKVVTKALGCTDVCYVSWWKDYKAPKAIFPYTE